MATKLKPRKVVFKKEYTFETIPETNKSFWIIDPDLLESGEVWKDQPPSKGYYEQYAYVEKQQRLVLINMTIDQLQQAICQRTLTKKDIKQVAVISSAFVAICNSRHKLIDKDQKEDAILISNWTGKIYSRLYSVAEDNHKPFQYFVLEACRSNRGCDSFVVIDAKLFEQLQIN